MPLLAMLPKFGVSYDFQRAFDQSTVDEFVSVDGGIATTGEPGNIVPSTSEGGHNGESNDNPLPRSFEVIGSLALVRALLREFGKLQPQLLRLFRQCGEVHVSQAVKLPKQKKIQDCFMRN